MRQKAAVKTGGIEGRDELSSVILAHCACISKTGLNPVENAAGASTKAGTHPDRGYMEIANLQISLHIPLLPKLLS